MSGSAFDQGGGGMFHFDPLSFALAGAAQAMGQASQPSRLPAGIGSTIGMGAGGLAQGLMGGQQYQHMGLQNQTLGLQNKLLEASIPSQLGMLNAANQYWSNQMQPAPGGAGVPFGVPSASGGGIGATPASTGTPRVGTSLGGGTPDYLLSPYEVKANMMFAMAKGQDTAAAKFAGILENYAGQGHALNRQGGAFAIPGSVGDPEDIRAREAALKQAGVGPELAIAGGKSAFEPPVVIKVPDGQGGFQDITIPRPNLPSLIGGQQQPGQDTSQSGGGALWQRNNNPGNIRFAGQPGAQQGAGGFAAFPDMQTGAAAIYDQLQHYQQRGQTTISQMIGGIGQPGQPGYVPGYAPPTENDTPKYIANLSLRTGIAPNQPVNLQDPQQARKIVDGIMQQETGGKFGLANLGQPAAAAAQPQNGLSMGAKGGGVQPAAFQAAAGGATPPQAGIRLPPGAIPGPPINTPQQQAQLDIAKEEQLAEAKQFPVRYDEVMKNAKESQYAMDRITQAQAAIDEARKGNLGPGAMSDEALAAAALAKYFHVNLQNFGIDQNMLASGQVARDNLVQLNLELLHRLFPTRTTNKDVTLGDKLVSYGMDPAAIDSLLGFMKQYAQFDVTKAADLNQYRAANHTQSGWQEQFTAKHGFGPPDLFAPGSAANPPGPPEKPAAAGPPAPERPAPVNEGDTIINKKTGERRVFQGGQWQPVPTQISGPKNASAVAGGKLPLAPDWGTWAKGGYRAPDGGPPAAVVPLPTPGQ